MKGIIQIGYTLKIDRNTTDAWAKAVWESTHFEYKLQVQNFAESKEFPQYSALLKVQPKAERLPHLVSAGMLGYLRNLGGKMPFVSNNLGLPALPFKNYRFQLIDSHLSDLSVHNISIYFLSEPLVWIETIGEKLLVAPVSETGEYKTALISLGSNLSIDSFKSFDHDQANTGHHLFESRSYSS